MRGRPSSDPLYWTICRTRLDNTWHILFLVTLHVIYVLPSSNHFLLLLMRITFPLQVLMVALTTFMNLKLVFLVFLNRMDDVVILWWKELNITYKEQSMVKYTEKCSGIQNHNSLVKCLKAKGCKHGKWTNLNPCLVLSESDSIWCTIFEFCEEKIIDIFKAYWSSNPSNLWWPKKIQEKSSASAMYVDDIKQAIVLYFFKIW